MKRYTFLIIFLTSLTACKTQQDNNGDKFDPDKTYLLQLKPVNGSNYYYDISNETTMEVEVDDKKVENINRAIIGINYTISRDSSNNLLLTSTYDKVKLYTNKDGVETDLDAENAGFSLNPIEKMLGLLKEASLTSVVNSTGEIINMTGYQELGEKVIASLGIDAASKNIAKQQWEKVVGAGFIRKNFDQLFKVFPDSAVRLNDTWRITNKEEGELPLTIKNVYKLKAINSELAIISCEGKIKSDNTTVNPGGYGHATAVLEGEQEAEYYMEIKTGMLISCKIKTEIKGTIKISGREVPVSINSSVKMNGKKIR